MSLEQKIEALLFYKNEPMDIKKIAKLLESEEKEVKEALRRLSASLSGRGICLVETQNEVSLATSPEVRGLMEKIVKDEEGEELGKAGLETLAIILYNGPVTRREIDYIRGVNSAFILRSLCMRGLAIKEPDPKDQRIWKYKTSLPLLAHLGIKNVEELPDFQELKENTKEIADGQEQN